MKMHLGVIDIPYVGQPDITTGDVAKILEDKYGLMQAFYDAHKDDIAADVTNAMEGALETLLMGGPPRVVITAASGAMTRVEAKFKTFLSSREAERVGIPGAPTQAALKGVNHRLKRRKGKRRPSFIDTGLLQSSFKAWVDEGEGNAGDQ